MNITGFHVDQFAEVHRMRHADLLAEAERVRLVRQLQEGRKCGEHQGRAQALLGWLRAAFSSSEYSPCTEISLAD